MPRPLRPLDPTAGPAQAFAADLRGLWDQAGRPTFLAMARSTGRSKTALSEAVGGDHLPTWETVEAFVRACGDDPRHWQARYERSAARLRPPAPPLPAPESAPAGDASPPALPVEQPDTPSAAGPTAPLQTQPDEPASHRPSRRLLQTVAAVVLLVGVAGGLLAWNAGRDTPNGAAGGGSAGAGPTVLVQNMIATGEDGLFEDRTPAYLSSRTVAHCRRRGCVLPGPELWSGATVPVTCHVRGDTFTNADLSSPGIKRNPGAVTSDRWYRTAPADGTAAGYLPEVYVAPGDRGGLGLPTCP